MSGKRLFWLVVPLLLVVLVFTVRQGFGRWMASFQLNQVENLVDRLDREGHLGRRESQRGVQLAFGEAVKRLRRAQELDPAEVGIPIARGGIHRLLDRHGAALEAFEAARELEPRPEVFAQLGHVYRAQGRAEEAQEAYASAILLDHTLARELRPYLDRSDKPERATEAARKRTNRNVTKNAPKGAGETSDE